MHELTTSPTFTKNLTKFRLGFGITNNRVDFVSGAVVVGLYTASWVAMVAGNLARKSEHLA